MVKYLLVFSKNNTLIELIISEDKNIQREIFRDINHPCSPILNISRKNEYYIVQRASRNNIKKLKKRNTTFQIYAEKKI